MLHAILTDIHGNLEALEAVLADVDRVGPASMVCLGDFVGYGASPNECIERLRPRLEEAVIGNHDLAAVGKLELRGFHNDAAAAARWTDLALTPENRAYLEALPFTRAWRGTRLTHGAPSAPAEWRYVLSARDARDLRFRRDDEIAIEPGHRYLVTVGSVGQPRDGDPRAGYVLYDERAELIRQVRVDYDVDGAMRRIRAAGLPAFLAERLQWGE